MWSGWWYGGILFVIVVLLAVILSRRGASTGRIGHNTPGSEAQGMWSSHNTGPPGG